MKALSIKEPFASLISKGIKRIETRSFKTNYRGEIYIHASASFSLKSLEGRNELLSLIKNLEFYPGYILCKANLVDCVYMTEEFIEDMKKNHHQEYICGYYEVGRYGWVLDDVKPLDEKIFAKGRLGIWNWSDKCE